jgi:hypothetical protein
MISLPIMIIVLCGCGWIWYQIQDRIGVEQTVEWNKYKKDHPEYFPKPEPIKKECGSAMSDEQKKST